MRSPHRITVDLILSAVHNHVGEDGMLNSFLFSSDPDKPHWRKNLSTTIFFSLKGMTDAALFVRSHGPPYLQALSIEEIREKLEEFLKNNFHDVSRETSFQRFTESYADRVSEPTKEALARSLSVSLIFSPMDELSLFPLVPVEVEEKFTSGPFFLQAPDTLCMEFDPEFHRFLTPENFPPLGTERFPTRHPKAWLGIRSPIIQASIKIKSAILGATALTLPLNRRHMFSLRKMFGGVCTINNGTTISFGDPHTPPLASDLIIRRCDEDWLTILAAKLNSTAKNDRRYLRALEYYYRAWPLMPSERFPFLCMALDATYGEQGRVTKSIVDGVKSDLGAHIDEKRLYLLMKIRGDVIHGGAPDVYDSRNYRKYYQNYSVDPINDLDEVVTESLRRRVFRRTMVLQEGPNTGAISRLKAEGKLPKTFDTRGILSIPHPTT